MLPSFYYPGEGRIILPYFVPTGLNSFKLPPKKARTPKGNILYWPTRNLGRPIKGIGAKKIRVIVSIYESSGIDISPLYAEQIKYLAYA